MPDFDLDVKFAPRFGIDDEVKWRVLLSDSDKGINVSAEDE